MSLPSELWSLILQKITDKKTCKNLYNSLSTKIKLDIENDYKKHYAILKQLFCISVNKRITIFDKEKNIKSLDHQIPISKIAFRPNTFEIIFSDKSGEIFLWNYVTDSKKILINISDDTSTSSENIVSQNNYFYVSNCGKYLVILQVPLTMSVTDDTTYLSKNLLYRFDIEQKRKRAIPFIFEAANTCFNVIFNPVREEITLASFFFRELGRFHLRLNIIDSISLVSNFFTNQKYYSPCYDEFGNLYVIKNREGVFKFVEGTFHPIMESQEYISQIIVRNETLFFAINFSHSTKLFLKSYKIKTGEIRDIYSIQSCFIRNVNISRNNKQLYFISNEFIVFLDIATNDIIKIIKSADFSEDELPSTYYRHLFFDFDAKKFSNYNIKTYNLKGN